MTTLLAASTIFLLAFGVHALCWRGGACAKNFVNLAAILFVSVAGLTSAGAWVMAPGAGIDWLRVLVLALGLAMAYIASYPAIQAESPSLLIVSRIHQARRQTMSEQQLLDSFDNQKLLEPRLDDLITAGLAARGDQGEGGRYRITGKGERLVGIFILFRRLMGAGKGG